MVAIIDRKLSDWLRLEDFAPTRLYFLAAVSDLLSSVRICISHAAILRSRVVKVWSVSHSNALFKTWLVKLWSAIFMIDKIRSP